MKTVAIYALWILGCTFAAHCIGGLVFAVFVSVNMNPSPLAMLIMAVVWLLMLLSGLTVGVIAAKHSTRKRPRRFFDSDDPYDSENQIATMDN
jgi:ABC-type polysaccharide/polyol phosphate export permease